MILATLATLAAAPTLVIVSWDGAPAWVVERLVAEGKLPNVARLAKEGISTEGVIPPFPSKTAVGHVALFTGTWPDKNGVTGNTVPRMPRSNHSILESFRGFDGAAHTAEPFWVSLAKGGKTALALSAAGSFPPEPDLERIGAAGADPAKFIEFSGFEFGMVPAKMVDVSRLPAGYLTLGQSTLTIRPIDDPADPTEGFDTVEIAFDGTVKNLKPASAANNLRHWAGPYEIRKDGKLGLVHFRLFSLDPKTGRSELLQREVNGMGSSQSPEETEAYLRAYGGFHDSPFSLYENNVLGAPLYSGGSGEAEARAVELVRLDCELLRRSVAYGLKKYKPDVLFQYTPMSDSAGHTWMGALDPESPVYKADLAAKIWPYYEQVFQIQDAWLGEVRKLAGPSAHIALVADHGMAGTSKRVSVNYLLAQAGLASYLPNGTIDLSKTKAVCPPWSDFAVVINGTDRKGGIVSPGERESVLAQVESILAQAKDPTTGVPLFPRRWRPEDFPSLGLGGPAGGDLYFDVPRGYYPAIRPNELVSAVPGNIGEGVHGFWPLRREMHTIFYAAGPKLGRRRLGTIDMTDIVPSLAAALNLPTPADATGAVHKLGKN